MHVQWGVRSIHCVQRQIFFFDKIVFLTIRNLRSMGGIGVFSISTISLLGFICMTDQMPLIILVSVGVLTSVYYFFVLRGKQQFSEEEKGQLFKAYLVNGKSRYVLMFSTY
jgi:hypothetical protein